MIELLNTNLVSGGWGGQNSGPGPQTLIAGTAEEGYFGTLTYETLLGSLDLIQHVGTPSGSVLNTRPDWLKFSSKGKVLFVAKEPILYNVIWDNLNGLGLTNGQTTLNSDELSFSIRLLSGAEADPGTVPSGEWNALIYKISEKDPTSAFWDVFTDFELNIGRDNGKQGYATLCRERAAGGIVTRGSAIISTYSVKLNYAANASFGWRPVLELMG